MGTFDELLKSGESLFKNELALDYSFLPKVIPYREAEMRHIAMTMKPLFDKRNGRNMLIYGPPGVGKTAACRHLIEELEEQTDEITPLYINCWQRNTSFKILIEICDTIGYKFTQNKRGDELFAVVKGILNKKSVVFIFDEIDKMDDLDFLYNLVEEMYRKSIILITNRKDWLATMDPRIRSRLTAEVLEFRPYNSAEIKGILQERMGFAFAPNIWEDDAFELIARKTAEISDMRSGFYLMHEAGIAAENRASKRITLKDVQSAISIFDQFNIKETDSLDEDPSLILSLIKEHSDKKIGDLFKIYQESGGKSSYKTFQRRIAKLEQDRFIRTEKLSGGAEGTTTIISAGTTKKLTEF